MNKLSTVLVAFGLALSAAAAVPIETRQEKALSLFAVVNFQNLECQDVKDKDVQGTCFSSTECTQKGGVVGGKCAAGFGVCCTFIIDNKTTGTVNHNLTIIQNNGYPTTTTTASATVDYRINAVTTDICMIRFDFIKLQLPITASTGVCNGAFTVTSPTGKNPPALCGNNDGYHMYAEVGASATATDVAITSGTGTSARTWRVKVSQIECDNPNKPPSDCVQYFTTVSGTFESYNFNDGLIQTALDYSVCFKPAMGMCGMAYSVDTGTTTPDPFGLQTTGGTAVNTNTGQARNIACSEGRIDISGVDPTTTGTYCGGVLNAINAAPNSGVVNTSGLPFKVGVVVVGTNVAGSSGFRLNYTQRSKC